MSYDNGRVHLQVYMSAVVHDIFWHAKHLRAGRPVTRGRGIGGRQGGVRRRKM